MPSGEHTGAHSGAHSPGRRANWDLVRIFLKVARFGSLRAAAEQNAKKITRVKHVVDGIEPSFDARKYPWFRGEFVHPREPLVNLFAGFKKVSRPKPIRFPNRANGSTR
jgi:hypothetical protein